MDFVLNFVSWFRGLPASGKLSLALVVIGTITAAILVQNEVKTSGYQYLFTNLSMSDTNAISEKLGSMNVDAQIRGDAILVPSHRVLELRNLLSEDGLPRGGGTGFEIFDQKNFGATEFEQRVNYIRAMQGELSRTIGAIDGIKKARVHIVLPEKSLFEKDASEPKASVALGLNKGRRLSSSQISGIVHLVVTAVEGLTEENINVVSQRGEVLFQAAGSDGSNLSSKNLSIRKEFEAGLSRRITRMLERIIGSGGVSVNVSANLDLARVEKTVEQIDPESRVAISEQLISDSTEGSSGKAGGVPGAASNVPGGGQDAAGGGQSESSERTESSTTYAISKTIQKVMEPVGEIEKLSVAVLVDGAYVKAQNPEGEEGAAKETYQPRSEEELQKIEDLVKRAVGFDESRGDTVEVENMQFQRLDTSSVEVDEFVSATNSSRWTMFLLDNAKVMGIILIFGILFFLLVKMINSYAPPVEMAYANLIGEQASSVANQLPGNGQVNIVKRDDQAAKEKAEQLAEKTPEVALQKGPEIEFKENEPKAKQVVVETPTTSEEKLRMQAAKMQAEQIIESNVDDAVNIVRSWMGEE